MTDRNGTKTVYIFLPYYKRGNLQDNINANNINKAFFPEKELFQFFLKVCYALKVLHTHTLPNIPMMTPSETLTSSEVQSDLTTQHPSPSSSNDATLIVPYGKKIESFRFF